MKRTPGITLPAALLLALIFHAPRATAVSATPGVISGVISGVITLDTSAAVPAPNFVPDVVTIDAADSSGLYTAHTNASQGGVAAAWCLSQRTRAPQSIAGITATANAAVASCKANGTVPPGCVQVSTGPVIGPRQ